MLSRALAAGKCTTLEPPERSKSSANSVLFSSDYPFPCLLNPEQDEGEEDTAGDDTAGGRDQEEDVFDDWDGLDDISSLRIASNTQRYAAAGPGQHRLVGVNGRPGTATGHVSVCTRLLDWEGLCLAINLVALLLHCPTWSEHMLM